MTPNLDFKVTSLFDAELSVVVCCCAWQRVDTCSHHIENRDFSEILRKGSSAALEVA